MKYDVDFQYLPKGSSRPIDDGIIVPHSTENGDPVIIPNVGDYVHLVRTSETEDHSQFSGRVRSRLFTYFGMSQCSVNVVVEETDDAVWGALIKE